MMQGFLCVLLLTLTPVLGTDLLTVASNNGCQQIVDLIRTAGLDGALKTAQSVTLFAPSDVAMGKVPAEVMNLLTHNATLLADVLKFHVVPQVARAADITNDLLLPTLADNGTKMRLNVYSSVVVTFESVVPPIHVSRNVTVVTAEGSGVIRTDLAADNGLVHVINKVIYPLPSYNLPITLTFDKDLNSLAYLMYEATLTQRLADTPFTVFAPSNAALNKLSGQLYNDLLMNITRLQEVLLTHVVRGVVFSSGLNNGDKLTNLLGTQLAILKGDNGIEVNHIKVTRADIPVTNGVIHIIDTAIMPKINK